MGIQITDCKDLYGECCPWRLVSRLPAKNMVEARVLKMVFLIEVLPPPCQASYDLKPPGD